MIRAERLPLRGWLLAEAVSLVGTRISMLAIPWFVLTTTGSAAKTGLAAAVEITPLVVMKALGGPLVDRYGARRVAITCDVASFVVVAAVPLLHGAGLLHFWGLLVLVALAGGLRGPGDGAKQAMVPALTAAAGVPLERVTGLHGAVERGASMVGAALAGGLIAWIGAASTLYLDAASFLVAAALIAGATARLPGSSAARPDAERDPAPYLVQLRDGWNFLRRDPVLLGLSLMVATTNLLDLAFSGVLMPVWAERHAGPEAIGLLLAAWSAAAALSALGAARWGHRIPRFATYVIAFAIAGLPRFAVLAFESPRWLLVAVFVLGGFASGFLNPILGAVIYERIPPELTGRVVSLNAAMCWSLMPFGGLLGGLLVAGAGLAPALLVTGTAYLLATLAPLVVPSFRDFDQRPVAPDNESVAIR